MTRQRLKLGLGLFCVAGVFCAVLFTFDAAAVQPELTEHAIPVDCSQARGRDGTDYLRHPDRPVCSMPWTTFRRLYPEIAEHTDESSWSG
jgi:hypothetical protein